MFTGRTPNEPNLAPGEPANRSWLLVFPGLFSKGVGVAAVIVGALVLVGWLFDITVLKSVFPGLVSMQETTAIAFIFAGLSLWLYGADRLWFRRLGR